MDKKIFKCPICDEVSFTYYHLLSHIRQFHEHDPNCKIPCIVEPCIKSYKNCKMFQRHILQKHKEFHSLNCKKLNYHRIPDIDCCMLDEHNASDFEEIYFDNLPDKYVELFDVENEVFNFFLSMKETNKVPWKSCRSIADNMSRLIEREKAKLLKTLINEIESLDFGCEQIKNVKTIIKASFNSSELENTIQHFSQLRNFKKYMKRNYNFVTPVSYRFGNNANMQSVQYIPLLDSLRALLHHNDVFMEVMNGHLSDDEIINDFCDGQHFKTNPLFSNGATNLCIQLYMDDVCLGNPLGSRVKQMKISAIYFSLLNISPCFRSRVYTIQLAMLFNPSLIKLVGLSEVLQPLIDDLKFLEAEGINIIRNGTVHNFKGSLAMICADNLAAHQLGGYDSFNAHRPCRRCLTTKEERRNKTHESHCELRTVDGYNRQVNDPNAKLYGLRFECPFNQLKYFDPCLGMPFDFDHDLLEGLVGIVIEQFIIYAVGKEYFTLEFLNQTILTFPYADEDLGNKPSPMSNDLKLLNVKQTASQCWCLLRLFPLMVGNKIPLYDRKWNVILTLMDILENVTSKHISKANMIHFSWIIEEFYLMYFEEFPNGKFTPKFHHLLHYPSQMLDYGPAVTHRTNRYESKHQCFKEYMNRTKNRRNIPMTLAERHESFQCANRTQDNFLQENFIHSNGKLMPTDALPSYYLQKIKQIFTNHPLLYMASKIMTKDNITYSVGSVIITKHYYDITNFSLIENIIIDKEEIYLMLHNLKTVAYIRHLHAFNVQTSCEYDVVNIKLLINKFQLGAYMHSLGMLILLKELPLHYPEVIIPFRKDKAFTGSLCLTYEGLSVKVSITDTVTLDVLKDLAKKNLALDFEFDLLVYDEVFGKQLLLLSLVDLKDAQEVFVRRKTNIAIEKPSQSIGGQSPSINKRILGSVLIRTFKVPDFGERITRKLQCGTNLDRSDRSNMLSSLFSAIMPVTLYPTPTEYEHVTTQLLDAFPRLGDIGRDLAWASWKTSIVFHFQSSRKNRQEINALPEVQKRSIKKRKLSLVNEEMQGSNKPILKNVAMWGMENYLPARLTEDNDETIAEHLLFLQNEVKKKRPNFERVESSMKSTFSDRRREIVKEGLSIQSVIEKYKFLREEEDILAEFTRLATLENNDCLENLITQGLKQLSKPLNQISRQYNFTDEITKDIVEKYRQQRTEDAVENLKIPFSVLVLLRLLQEKWQNIFVKEGADCPEGVEVFIAFEGDTLMDEGLSVHVDGTIIKCSSLVKSICVFLALHFVFNIKYNRKVTKFLIYIEKFIAKITSNIGIPQAVVKTQVKILEALKIN